MIDTRKLRDGPYLHEGRETKQIMDHAADLIEALDGQVAEYARMMTELRSEAAARLDTQAAEIARLREVLTELLGWQSTAPWKVIDEARAVLEQGESK